MRARTLILLFFAIVLAGGTALLARSWLAAERSKELAEAAPMALPTPAKSVLVARSEIRRGQILRPEEMVWQTWPEGGLDKSYIVMGGVPPRTPETFAGWVAKNPIVGGEPISEAKIIAPGNRGFLAAVLRPGMRAISVPVTITSGISGFIFPGDQVDLLLTYSVPVTATAGDKDKKETYQHKAAQTVLRDIRVIAIDQRLESKPGEAVVAHTATFEVSAKQTEVILLASEIGKVTLILRPLVPDPAEQAATEPSRAEAPDTDRRLVATLISAATPASKPRSVEPSERTAGLPSAATVGAPKAVTVVSGPLADSAPATSPSRGPRIVTPSAPAADSSPGANATYTLDNEISKLLPQPKGVKENPDPPKLWICKGPALNCSNPASDSAGDRFLAAFQEMKGQGATFTPGGR
jgi:pilus assembly protein CpaB